MDSSKRELLKIFRMNDKNMLSLDLRFLKPVTNL